MVPGIAVVVVQPGKRASALLKLAKHAAYGVRLQDDSVLLGADRARDLHVAAHELIGLVQMATGQLRLKTHLSQVHLSLRAVNGKQSWVTSGIHVVNH